MNRVRHSIRLLALLVAAIAVTPARAGEVAFQRFGLYVLVDDVPRAEEFYQRLFARPPQVRTPALIGFDIAGGLFAIVSKQAYAPEARLGNSVRPYIRVENLAAFYARVRRVAPDSLLTPVIEEGPFSFFRLADPEGNVLEFFALAAASD